MIIFMDTFRQQTLDVEESYFAGNTSTEQGKAL